MVLEEEVIILTFKNFMEKYGLKNSATVRTWIESGFIPGADYEADFVPDEARPPYVRARAKKPGAIYVSIVRALINGFRPIPDRYPTITKEEFYDVYMASLISSGIAIAKKDDSLGITNYYPSEKAMKYVLENDKELLSQIKTSLETVGKVIGSGVDFVFEFFSNS